MGERGVDAADLAVSGMKSGPWWRVAGMVGVR